MILSLEGLFKFLLLMLTVSYAMTFTSLNLLPYTLWMLISVITILLIIVLKPKYFNTEDLPLIWPIRLYLIWNMISVIRGVFIAENYWEWKNLVSIAVVMMVPLFVYISTNKEFVQQIVKFWLKYALLVFLLFLPFITSSDFYGRYFVIIMFLLLFLPILSTQWKIFVLFFTLLVFSAGLEARSTIIRFGMSGLLGLLYYIRFFMKEWIFKVLHTLLMLLPILLLVLGIFNVFNVFKMDQYLDGHYTVVSTVAGKTGKESLTSDTRTFIYIENIKSALKHDYILQGRTPANGYDSNHFGGFVQWELHTGKKVRFASEVSILNVFLWTGLIGVILYFLVFLRASYLAIYKSNSFFMKIIGLFVAFRWSYAFVEDFTKFELLYIFLWITIGMCYSTAFRKMNDDEFKEWVLGLLPRIVYRKNK